jgi:hypothetical protein
VIITKLPANRMAETERKKVVEKGWRGGGLTKIFSLTKSP